MQSALEVAPKLLGALVFTFLPAAPGQGPVATAGRIVETEAYCGPEDRAAHSSRGPRHGRTAVLWRTSGHAYCYLIYGMHTCLNVSCGADGVPHCVLIRAIEPLLGLDAMRARVKASRQPPVHQLASGPGRLCRVLGISTACNGWPLSHGPLRILRNTSAELPPMAIDTSPRINVDYAGDDAALPWRFFQRGNRHVSGGAPRNTQG